MTDHLSPLAKDILEGLQNASAYTEGKTVANLKTHQISVPDVKAVREKLNLSQQSFADKFHIPLGTLRNWEQGRRVPDITGCLLLHIIEKEPETVQRLLNS